jgi:hypothetical protein
VALSKPMADPLSFGDATLLPPEWRLIEGRLPAGVIQTQRNSIDMRNVRTDARWLPIASILPWVRR